MRCAASGIAPVDKLALSDCMLFRSMRYQQVCQFGLAVTDTGGSVEFETHSATGSPQFRKLRTRSWDMEIDHGCAAARARKHVHMTIANKLHGKRRTICGSCGVHVSGSVAS